MTLDVETLAAYQSPGRCFPLLSTLQFNEQQGREHYKREMIEMEPICTSTAANTAVTRTKTDIDEEVQASRREQEAVAISMFN